jgi:subtilisin family serine protease
MAGVAGASDNGIAVVGVAPGVRLHGVKVLDCAGRGTDLNALSGLEWVIGNGRKPGVITMSFGGPISRAFDDGVQRALNAGFVVVTAAGNDHKDACKFSPAHMGTLQGVITVGASTKRSRPATFTNRGDCVDVYAPGVRIVSTYLNGALAAATGTSASAPHVAGAAALYLSNNGSASPAAVESAIKSSAVHMGRLLRLNAATF